MTDSVAIASALLLGITGSSHCLGMCGGISAALGIATERKRVLMTLTYNLGRILSYAILGAIFGGIVQFAGHTVQPWLPTLGLWLRALTGLLVIAMGLYVGGWWLGLTRIEQIGGRLWKHVQPLTKNLLPPRNLGAAWTLGALWGLLPCGLIYSTLSWAAARGNFLESAQLMAVFGLGTLPAMFVTTLGGQQLQRQLQTPWLRKLAGVLLIVFGILTIAVPWRHASHNHSDHEHHHTP